MTRLTPQANDRIHSGFPVLIALAWEGRRSETRLACTYTFTPEPLWN
ncbi:MAG: hypothetical protein Q4G68_10410 [Planctomycetia bacterium]|nr:hypothetical protein [Planctomycetia bacterium]